VEIVKTANLGLRFLLELCALAALGYWGFRTGQGLPAKLGLGVGAPLLAAVIWGVFVAPKAPVRVPTAVWLLLQLAIFGAAVAGLFAAGHPRLAWALGVAVAINGLLMYAWGQ
jgi:hypothetical protein